MAFSNDPKILVRYGLFFNSKAVTYSAYGVDVCIPAYESSDGPTLNWFTKLFFTLEDYRRGIDAAIVHDYMCRHKALYDRNVSSKMLRDIWVACGLPKWKGYLMYLFVDLYQLVKYGKTWGSAL
jgi:hypothetical protein